MISWWEDMAERHGPCISPRLYKEYLLSHYKKTTGFFRRNKIDHMLMDSDGNINPLLGLIIEAGITGLWPLEVNAGMDAITIKRKYGESCSRWGTWTKGSLPKEQKGSIGLSTTCLNALHL